MTIKTGKKFKAFLTKHCPKDFKKLVKYTVYNDRKLAEGEWVDEGGIYELGHVIEKKNGIYKFISRTVEYGEEKMNSWAVFDNEMNFTKGQVNCFAGGWIDDDGSYHTQLFGEVVRKKKWEWDVVE